MSYVVNVNINKLKFQQDMNTNITTLSFFYDESFGHHITPDACPIDIKNSLIDMFCDYSDFNVTGHIENGILNIIEVEVEGRDLDAIEIMDCWIIANNPSNIEIDKTII